MHLDKLLAHGLLPSHLTRTRRRVDISDIADYRRAREARAAGLDELAVLSALILDQS